MPLRKDDLVFDRKLIAILAALLLASCTASTSTVTSTTTATVVEPGELSAADLPDENLDASADTSAIAVASGTDQTRRRPLLAIEVEITPTTVKTLGVRIMQAPPLANSAHDELHVKIEGAREFEYSIADPLVATVHDENGTRTITLESARTHVFAPLLPGLTTLTITPANQTEAARVRGGTIDLRVLAEEACRRTPLPLPVCRQILGQR